MVRAIIFDFGSVIYKTDWESFNNEFKEKFHVSMRLTENTDDELLRIHRASDLGKEDFKKFFHRLGITDAATALQEYKRLYQKYKILNQGLIRIIKQLKKRYLLFGFTDVKRDHYDANHEMGLYEDFKHIFTSFTFGVLKADATAFEKVKKELQKYQLEPQECLFIDDHLPNIENARQQGFKTIHYADFPSIGRLQNELEKTLGKDFERSKSVQTI